jgi:hypothetical protein
VIALAIAGTALFRRVFISYRRQVSEHLAQLVRANLVGHGFDAYLDVENLDSGEFDRKILSEIEARMHFIVLLQPGSLDRIGEDGDWLRREIAHALAHDRNVIPVTASRFEFHRGLVLPPDVERLQGFQAVDIPSGPLRYFNAAMKELRGEGFLKKPLKLPGPPRPETRSVVEEGRRAPQRSGTPTSAGERVIRSPPRILPNAGNILSRVPRSETPPPILLKPKPISAMPLPATELLATPKSDEQIEREADATRASAAEAQAQRETRAPDTSA